MERRSKPTDHGCGSLPTFLIVGERRCGTTSLAKWMEDHPDIFMHPKPDMAFFVDDEIVGRREWLDGEIDESTWGRTHSKESYAALFAEGTDRAAIGEKSADYLFWRPSHARIARFLPTAKVIVTLRHPVERAWSHYWNEVGKGRETLSFEEALEQEDDRSRRSAYARNHLSYRTRGYYDESLTDLFAHIPRDRTMVVTLEEAQQRPAELLRQIYTFIGVDAEQGLNHVNHQGATRTGGRSRTTEAAHTIERT